LPYYLEKGKKKEIAYGANNTRATIAWGKPEKGRPKEEL